MPSAATLMTGAVMGGGAAAGGYAAYRYAQGRRDFDNQDKLGFTGSAAIAGAAAGLALRTVGVNNVIKAGGYGLKGTNYIRKALLANPVRDAIDKGGTMGGLLKSLRVGQGFKSSGPGLRSLTSRIKLGGAFALAFTAATAAVAMSPRDQVQRMDRAERDQSGGYTPTPGGMTTREKMGIMGATGDMVFGMNNSRHG